PLVGDVDDLPGVERLPAFRAGLLVGVDRLQLGPPGGAARERAELLRDGLRVVVEDDGVRAPAQRSAVSTLARARVDVLVALLLPPGRGHVHVDAEIAARDAAARDAAARDAAARDAAAPVATARPPAAAPPAAAAADRARAAERGQPAQRDGARVAGLERG